MPYENIEVIAYAGFRGEESPRAFIVHYKKIEVSEILDVWVEENIYERVRKRFFKSMGSDKKIYNIYSDEYAHEWFYESENK